MRDMEMNEQWKPVVGFPGYEVSSLGRVRSLMRCQSKGGAMIRPDVDRKGRLRVRMMRGEKQLSRFVSRLVAEAFLPDWDPALQLDHRFGDRSKNAASDLRMATDGQNKRAYLNLKRGATSRFRGVSWDKSERKWRAQICFDDRRQSVGRFACEIEAAKAYDAKAVELGFLPEALNFPR